VRGRCYCASQKTTSQQKPDGNLTARVVRLLRHRVAPIHRTTTERITSRPTHQITTTSLTHAGPSMSKKDDDSGSATKKSVRSQPDYAEPMIRLPLRRRPCLCQRTILWPRHSRLTTLRTRQCQSTQQGATPRKRPTTRSAIDRSTRVTNPVMRHSPNRILPPNFVVSPHHPRETDAASATGKKRG
jgi:hypothetical protein